MFSSGNVWGKMWSKKNKKEKYNEIKSERK